MSETVIVTPEPALPADADEVRAARAEASAQAAQEAASSAVVMADVAAAQAGAQAAQEINAYQERLAQCEARLQTAIQSQGALSAELAEHRTATESRMAEAMDRLTSIQSRLAPPPANPENPEPASAEGVPPAVAEPAREPELPRKRAHRWI